MITDEGTLPRQSDIQDLSLRSASREDVPAIVSLDQRIWGQWANPATLYRQLIDLFPETVLVAYKGEAQYAGCAVGLIRTKPTTGWVLSIDIAEEFRGQGLGKLLITELLAAFHRLDVEKIVAIIDPANKASQRLFASFEFEQAGIEKDYFGPGKDQQRWEIGLRR